MTSALMESFIKGINDRVKRSDKFWNDPTGADLILVLRTAILSEDDRLEQNLTE